VPGARDGPGRLRHLAVREVEAFVQDVVEPMRARYKARIGQDVELKV
jgi:hypothetical protein